MAISSSYGNWKFSWPYPRAHFSSYYTLGLAPADWGSVNGVTPQGYDSIILFELYCSNETWYATPIANMGLSTTIDQVSFATFGNFYLVSVFDESGEKVVMYARNPSRPSGVNSCVRMKNIAKPEGVCACNFKGQIILGGVSSSLDPWRDLGWCSVAWAAPGSLEFNLEVSRGAGFATLPLDDYGKGYIYDIRRQGDHLIVYGTHGVCGLKPFSNEVITGFAVMDDWHYPGLASGNQVAGDHKIHAYISNENELWIVQGNAEFKDLGYKEFLELLVNPIISYVPQKERFYISDGRRSYVLTKYGMYECHQATSGVGVYRGKLCGFFKDLKDYEWRFHSTPMDFGLRALKFLEVMEIGAGYYKTGGVISGRVNYKYNYGDNGFTEGTWIRADKRGVLFPRITANEFVLGVKGTDYREAELNLDYLNCGIKLVDKHGIRRAYGNTSKGVSRASE